MPAPENTPCRFGYVEHDGYQYCHEHCGWHHYVDRRQRCDRADIPAPERNQP